MNKPGTVFLVGAGPGDPDLLTMKAVRVLKMAHVVVIDRLVSPEIVKVIPSATRQIAVGKAPGHHPVPQHEINAILVDEALRGHTVARLKGGDPFVFGRGCEEAIALASAGLHVEVIPGITAAQGVSTATGVPLTHRGLASSVRFITGHCRQDQTLDLDWEGLADPDTTLVIYMGCASIGKISNRLIASGLSSRTPVLAVSNGTTPREHRLISSLADISTDLHAAELSGPVLFIVGHVVDLNTVVAQAQQRTRYQKRPAQQVGAYV